MKRPRHPVVPVLGIFVLIVTAAAAPVRAQGKKDEPRKLELSGAEKRIEDFEKKVKRMRGQPFKLGYPEKDALGRLKKLSDKYPDHPKVKELVERARQALIASKGEMVKVNPDWIRFRDNEKKLKKLFFDEAQKQWAAYKAKIEGSGKLIAKPWPPASHREVGIDEMVGKYVILDNFEYPTHEFSDMGRQFVFCGSGARGYYYVELSNRSWLGAYEAAKRYRRFVNRDMPEGMTWTLVGKITGLELVVPQAGKKKTFAAHWGWSVEPAAIFVPERTFTVADGQLELGGRFAGEERMEQIKGSMYSVTSVPDDVTPERLTEIYVTAIKEKNWKLYLDCIDPERRETKKGVALCMYHWEWHQHRFATMYVHVNVGKATISVLKGFDESDEAGGWLLSEEEKAKLRAVSGPLVEQAELKTQAIDERGVQYGSPKPRFFKRIAKKRWYITNYPQPF